MDIQIGGKAKAGGNSSEDSKDKTQIAKSNVPFRVRKGQVQVVKFSVVSRYDKQVLDEFDEYASNSISFEIGDMVWGKVKSHPWWPGHVFSEVLASPEVKRSKIEGQVLVAFFGDSSYGWFYPADLLPFESHFSEKCRQKSSSRNFVKAVEEAVDEVTRRSGLGLECRCRNRENFRDSGVEGYFCVDVCGCEPGSVYSVDQIRKARDSFKLMEMVEFLNQLAVSPTGNEDQGIEFMKKKAAVVAYRKVVYREVDETYDQAFGHIPEVRTSLRKTLATGQSPKLPIRVIEINSDTSVAEAVKIMAQHNILSVPVVDVDAPEDATWIDRYLGIIEYAGIVVWILHQSEKKDGSANTDFIPESEELMSPAVARAASGMSSPRYKGANRFDEASISGDFFEALTNSEFYKNAKVRDISGSFRWAPFLALQSSNSFLTMLLLLSEYRMKSVPVVDLGEGKIENIITQSAVIHMLQECAGLQWFESWGTMKIWELGLPLMKPSRVVKIYHSQELPLCCWKLS